MFKKIAIGLGVVGLILIVTVVLNTPAMFLRLSGFVAIGTWGLAAVLSGILAPTGDRIRANYTNEPEEQRKQRNSWAMSLFLIGLPSVAGAILYVLLVK